MDFACNQFAHCFYSWRSFLNNVALKSMCQVQLEFHTMYTKKNVAGKLPFALLVACCFLPNWGCDRQGTVTIASSAGAADSSLLCSEPRVNLGIVHSLVHEHEFQVENVSDDTVHITKIVKSCACYDVDISATKLEPGETSTILLRMEVSVMEVGKVEHFLARLKVQIDDNPRPELILALEGQYLPLIYRLNDQVNIPEPDQIDQTYEGQVDFFVNSELGVEIVAVESEGQLPLKTKIESATQIPGTTYSKKMIKLSGVLPSDVELPVSATLRVKTNNQIQPESSVLVSMHPADTTRVVANPSVVAFGVAQDLVPGISKQLRLEMSNRSGLHLVKADSSLPYLRTKQVNSSDVKYAEELLIDCVLDVQACDEQVVDGRLTFTVESGGREFECQVPVSGFIRDIKEEGDG